MSRDGEDRRTAGALHAEIREPLRAVAQDRRHRRHGLGVVDGGGRAVEPVVGGERRLEARLARLAFQRFEQRGFLAADVGARADKGMQLVVDTGVVKVAPEPAGLVGLAHGGLEAHHGVAQELAANVVVAHRGAHGVAADGHALDDRVGVVAENFPIVAGARLALVGIADKVLLDVLVAGHEAPLQARGEPGAAAAAQPRGLDLVDDRLPRPAALEHLLPGPVPALSQVVRKRPRLGGRIHGRQADSMVFVAGHVTPAPPESGRPSPASDSRDRCDPPSSSARRNTPPGTLPRA